MSDIDRLRLLTGQMQLEVTDTADRSPESRPDGVRVSHARLPNGKRIPLLKTLLSSYCENDCYYCPFRSGRDFRRTAFQPDGFARLFLSLHRAGIVTGLFLSSGLHNGGVITQDKLLDTASLLRRRYQFSGYLHLKIMPGAEKAQILEAMRLADRVSINLEAPTPDSLQHIAPRKRFQEDLLTSLLEMEAIRQEQPAHRAWKGRWPSSTTQFVVGSSDESDLDLLSTTSFLHQQAGLTRAYFSPFNPVEDTPLAQQPAAPPQRQQRLYQASFLIKDYGFEVEELPFDQHGMLPLYEDPKTAWAKAHLAEGSIEVNTAPYSTLLRIPGIGPTTAQRILTLRQEHTINHAEPLAQAGAAMVKANPYILMNGKSPIRQLRFF